MDYNINTSLKVKHNKKYKITDLFDQRLIHINYNDITQHNHDYTRYVSHQPPKHSDQQKYIFKPLYSN